MNAKDKEMKTINIKHFPCELHIEADNGNTYTINYDGQQGQFSRDEWRDDDVVSLFDKDSQDEILQSLEMTCNGLFFRPDFIGSLVTYNADPFLVETEEDEEDVINSFDKNPSFAVYWPDMPNQEEWRDAMRKLDLTEENRPKRIFVRLGEDHMYFCLRNDWEVQ